MFLLALCVSLFSQSHRAYSSWNDSMMVYKQPAMGSAILWGEGLLWGDSTMVANNQSLWVGTVRVHTSGLLKTTAGKWANLFVDPYSISDLTESTLAFGETGQTNGLRVGPPGSWFYPGY